MTGCVGESANKTTRCCGKYRVEMRCVSSPHYSIYERGDNLG